ncbi:unnamed protein product [Ranitomeya imitator]|uniref:Uncharacterized protein n=1 Tax=Ranitomeya imitator TaxID=111125 RepID=A0ABN9KY21_9NEOB|nr:unnamed protein product [Ranitomeya imitator]
MPTRMEVKMSQTSESSDLGRVLVDDDVMMDGSDLTVHKEQEIRDWIEQQTDDAPPLSKNLTNHVIPKPPSDQSRACEDWNEPSPWMTRAGAGGLRRARGA